MPPAVPRNETRPAPDAGIPAASYRQPSKRQTYGTWIAPLLATATLSCGPEARPIDPALDPQLIAVDYAAPSNRFDGSSGSLLLGEGWAPIEHAKHETDKPIGFAWVTSADATATLRFERPPAEAIDFVARCRPFTFEGAPEQTITVAVGKHDVVTRPLGADWQLIRAPLPDAALSAGLNTLQVRFGYSKNPCVVVHDWPEDRRLSAA